MYSGLRSGLRSGTRSGLVQALSANFTAARVGLGVTCTDTTVGSAVSWAWDFGDESGTSTSQNPTYTYATIGTFTITLTVTDNTGRTSQKTAQVTTRCEPVLLTSGADTTDATSWATASITPAANRLCIIAVEHQRGAASIATPTVSGCNLTWVIVDATNGNSVNSGATRRLTMFRALDASPAPGALTIDFGGQTQDMCIWHVFQFSGADASGTHGSGAVVQVAKTTPGGSDVTTATCTLSAFGDTDNVHLCVTAKNGTTDFTVDADGFAELAENGISSNRMQSQWAVNQVACTTTWTTGARPHQVSIEVKAI